jgi:imidazolonepropionase-like amidohydrolase
MIGRRALLGGAAALFADAALAQTAPDKPLALAGGTLLRHDAAPLEKSIVVLQDGKITYAGDDGGRAAGATVIDTTGKTVTAGLCDVLTQVGVVEVDLEPSTRDNTLEDRRITSARRS